MGDSLASNTRKPWQIRLITAEVLMFVAGGITWAMVESYYWPSEDTFGFGFPWIFYISVEPGLFWAEIASNWLAIAGDVLFVLTAIVAAGFVCEWVAKHKSRSIHRSTAIVLLIAVCILIFVNLQWRVKSASDGVFKDLIIEPFEEERGWPSAYQVRDIKLFSVSTLESYSSIGLLHDVIAAAYILLGAAIVVEWAVRARARTLSEPKAEQPGEKKGGKRENGEQKEERD